MFKKLMAGKSVTLCCVPSVLCFALRTEKKYPFFFSLILPVSMLIDFHYFLVIAAS